jgi:hypothetical protein
MTTVLDKAARPLRFDGQSDGQVNFLIASENYAMALDELQSAAAELRAAFDTLEILSEQCRLVAAGATAAEESAR